MLEQFSILTPENELKPDAVLDVAASQKLVKETGEAFEKSRWLRPELGEGELSALLCRILRTMEPKYNMILDWSEDL